MAVTSLDCLVVSAAIFLQAPKPADQPIASPTGLASARMSVAASGTPAPLAVLDCRVKYVEEAMAPAATAGQIAEILVRPGTQVVKGQVLAKLDDRLASLDLKLRESAATNVAGLAAAEARLKLYRSEATTATSLVQSGGGSREEAEQRRIRVIVAEEELKNETAKLREAAIERDKAAEMAARHLIRSPIAGVVRQLRKHVGEAVQQYEPAFHIVSTARMRIEGEVDLSHRDRIRPDQTVLVHPSVEVAESAVALHPAETTAVVFLGDEQRMVFASLDGTLTLFDATLRKRLRTSKPFGTGLQAIALFENDPQNARSPSQLAVGGTDGRIFLLDSELLDEPRILTTEATSAVTSLAAVGNHLFVGRETGELTQWDVSKGSVARRLSPVGSGNAHVNRVTGLQISPDGRWLASVGDDAFLRLWEVKGTGMQEWPGRTFVSRAPVRRIGFSPTSDAAAFNGRGLMQLRRISDGLSLEDVVATDRPPCHFLMLPPSGGLLMTGDEEGRLALWRLPTPRRPIAIFARSFVGNPRGYAVHDMAFSKSGRQAATACADGSVRVWRMPTLAEMEAETLVGKIVFVSPQAEAGAKPRLTFHVEVDDPRTVLTANSTATVVTP